MGDGNHSLDEALDRLADLGVSALARDVFEPVNAAMIARAKSEMQTRSGAMSFFSDYWSVARAAAAVFDEPKFARQAAAMFFSGAPERCSAWAAIELVDGKPRLGISDLRDLATAASSARDRNSGAFNAVLMDAMIARPDDEAREALAAAESREAPKSPKAWAALRKEAAQFPAWICDERLDEAIEIMVKASIDGAEPAQSWALAVDSFESRAVELGNHGLAALFGIKAAARVASEPLCLGWGACDWLSVSARIAQWSKLAAEESAAFKAGSNKKLRDVDLRMLSGWTQALAGARERLASEIALGALERSAEPRGAEAAIGLVAFLKDSFWGAGAAMSDRPDLFQDMAGALCNRFCRDGALACLPLPAAREMLGSMSSMKGSAPENWMPSTDPETVGWLLEMSAEPVRGAQWRQLAAFARVGEIGPTRQASWVRAMRAGQWTLASDGPSMDDAASAMAIAKTLGPASELGSEISAELSKFGVKERDALGPLQDFLLALPDLGASPSACERASSAMAEALSVLEREALCGAIAAPQLENASARRANRL